MSDSTALPTDLDQLRVRAAQGKQFKFLFYWGHQPSQDGVIAKSCLSRWYPAPFAVEGLLYPTAEHWMMMMERARLIKPRET